MGRRIVFGLLVVCAVLSISGFAYATIQELDDIIYEGERYNIDVFPASTYPGLPEFDVLNTANWDGYRAQWAIKDDQLYLTKFEAFKDKMPVKVSDVFKGHEDLPIKADWYTGQIKVFCGETGWAPTPLGLDSSEYIIIRVKEGDVLSAHRIKNNSWKKDPLLFSDSPLSEKPLRFKIKDVGGRLLEVK